jgi:hypothetical protein
MRSNIISFEPPASAAAVDQIEPLEAAVRELSARIAENNDQRRLLFSRLDELRGLSPGLRRRSARPLPPAMSSPVTFFSIEEADTSVSAPLQLARGGR